MARRLKRTGLPVDPKDDDTIAILVGNEAELSRRVDVKVSRRFDIGGLVLDESQCVLDPSKALGSVVTVWSCVRAPEADS